MITFYFSQTDSKFLKGSFTPVFLFDSDKNAIILLWPPDEFQPWTNLSFQTTSRWKMSKTFLRTVRRESNIMPGSPRLQTSWEKSLHCHLRRPGTTLKFIVSYLHFFKLKCFQKLKCQKLSLHFSFRRKSAGGVSTLASGHGGLTFVLDDDQVGAF